MREIWIAGSLLWLAGVSLRLSILAVPPVIALIQSDLRLSGTEVGLLSGLPTILFAMAALPGSLLIARLGARSEEHTSELQSLTNLVCRLLLEKKQDKRRDPAV